MIAYSLYTEEFKLPLDKNIVRFGFYFVDCIAFTAGSISVFRIIIWTSRALLIDED